jgi:Fe-S cluster biogenesis protein NfuA
VANDTEYQEQIRQLGKLVAEWDQLPDSASKNAGRELVQLLMDVHGAGLERMMEIIFECAEGGPAIIHKLGQDDRTGSLLLLYSLHPDDLETRVQKAADHIRPRLRKLACTVDSVDVHDGVVKVHLSTAGHGCGSSAGDIRSIVEEGIYELAPDVTSLEILGLEPPVPSGFVSLEKLIGSPLIAVGSNGHVMAESEGAD